MADADARDDDCPSLEGFIVLFHRASPEARERALRAAYVALAPRPETDAMGAPIETWTDLQREVKQIIRAVGWESAARHYGAAPETLRSVLKRKEPPGLGARARLARLVRK